MRRGLFILFTIFSTIQLFAQIEAQFSVDVDSGCVPLNITITDLSTKTGTVSYTWDFGKGEAVSTETKKVLYTFYDEPGVYTIALTISNGSEESSFSKEITVFKLPQARVVPIQETCIPNPVIFTADPIEGDAPIKNYIWDLKDGNIYYGKTQSKVYSSGGNYDYSLSVIDENGCISPVNGSIKVWDRVVADFDLSDDFACVPPLNVSVTNTSYSEAAITYTWTYNDGTSYTGETPPDRTFTQLGNYSLKLELDNDMNCHDEIEKPMRVFSVQAQFDMYYPSVIAENKINGGSNPIGYYFFENTTIGTISDSWKVNGNVSNTPSLTYLFCEAGIYDITLIAGQETVCADTLTKQLTVNDELPWEITMKQYGNTITDDKICTDMFNVLNPVPYSSAYWTYHNVPKTGNSAVFQDCRLGLDTIYLESRFSSSCIVERSKVFTREQCNPLDFKIMNNGEELLTDDACTGSFSFVAPTDVVKSTFKLYKYSYISFSYYLVDTVMDIRMDTMFCDVLGSDNYKIVLQAAFSDGCLQEKEKIFSVQKCERPFFTMYNGTTNESLSMGDEVCELDSIVLTPGDIGIYKGWKGAVDSVDTNPDSLIYEWTYYDTGNYRIYKMDALMDNGCMDVASAVLFSVHLDLDFEPVVEDWKCYSGFKGDFLNTSLLNYDTLIWSVSTGDTIWRDTVLNNDRTYSIDVEWDPSWQHDSVSHSANEGLHYVDVNLYAIDERGCRGRANWYKSLQRPAAWYFPDITYGCEPLNINLRGYNSRAVFGSNEQSIFYLFGIDFDFDDFWEQTDDPAKDLKQLIDETLANADKGSEFEAEFNRLGFNAILDSLIMMDSLTEEFDTIPGFKAMMKELFEQSISQFNFSFADFPRYTQVRWEMGDGTVTALDTPYLKYEIDEFLDCMASKIGQQSANVLDYVSRFFLSESGGYWSYYKIYDMLLSEDKNKINFVNECLDGVLAQSMAINHTYTTPGTYYPKLIIEDENGCVDTAMSHKIRVGDHLSPNFAISPTTVCPNEAVQFTNLTPNAHLVDSWHYRSEEAHLVTGCDAGPNPELYIAPDSTGQFDVSLTVGYNGCFSSVTLTDALEVKGPIANINWEPLCNGSRDYYFDADIYDAETWTWDMGDGTIVTNTNKFVHTYVLSKDYTVVLTATNTTTGCSPFSDTVTIPARALDAKLTIDSVLCLGESYLPDLDTLSVDFNKTGGDMAPFLLYVDGEPLQRSRDGIYTIPAGFAEASKVLELHVFDENWCEDTDTVTVRVHKTNADFAVNRNYICAVDDSLELEFLSLDTTTVFWSWNVRDSIMSYYVDSIVSPEDSVKISHYFITDTVGQFQVALTVENIWGCKVKNSMFVDELAPVVSGTITDNTVCVGGNLLLNDDSKISSGSKTTDWYLLRPNIADSIVAFANTASPQHSFPLNERGTFKVMQVVHEKRCTDTTFYDFVDVQQVDASFEIIDDTICENDELAAYQLNVLDASYGSWQVAGLPSVQYTDSTYQQEIAAYGSKTLSLRVYSPYGCTDTKSNPIEINSARFTVSDATTCKDTEITFTLLYQNSDSIYIYYGDGDTAIFSGTNEIKHSYDQRGNYDVKVISYKEGCHDTSLVETLMNVEDVNAHFETNDEEFCRGDFLTMSHPAENVLDAYTGTWYLGGGSNTGTYTIGEETIMLLGTNGTYSIGLKVFSPNGCTDEVLKNISVSGPYGKMNVPVTKVCRSVGVEFQMYDTLGVDKFIWVFGDGNADSVETNPFHPYEVSGFLTAQMMLIDSVGCKHIETKAITIEQVDAGFYLDPSLICQNGTVRIVDTSKNNTVWNWNFANGNTSSDAIPADQQYTEPGEKTLTLYIKNQTGCEHTAEQTLTVVPLPKVALTAKDSICIDSSVTIIATYDSDSLQWYQDGIKLDNDNKASYYDAPVLTTDYSVAAFDQYGCFNYDTVRVAVLQYPEHLLSTYQQRGTHYEKEVTIPLENVYDTAFYIGQVFEPTIIAPYPSTYKWEPDSTISSLTSNSPDMQPLEDISYFLTVTDQCFIREYQFDLTVVPESVFDVPTGFTPNGDGNNEKLYVRGWGVKDLLEFSIYNRWGQLLYNSEDINEGWDGKYNGKDQPIDTYVYKVRVTTYLDDEREMKGYVTLMR